MKKSYLIIAALSSILLFGCIRDKDLDKSIMIYDPEYPELPIYSEWGYNTFGAFFDRDVFISDDNQVPTKITVGNGIATIEFNGLLNEYSDNHMSVTFRIKNLNPSPDNITELEVLNNVTYDLTGNNVEVEIYINGSTYPVSVYEGTLHFKRFQNIYVDKKFKEVVLSGTFEMKVKYNNESHTFTNGRFDFGITNDYFYKN